MTVITFRRFMTIMRIQPSLLLLYARKLSITADATQTAVDGQTAVCEKASSFVGRISLRVE